MAELSLPPSLSTPLRLKAFFLLRLCNLDELRLCLHHLTLHLSIPSLCHDIQFKTISDITTAMFTSPLVFCQRSVEIAVLAQSNNHNYLYTVWSCYVSTDPAALQDWYHRHDALIEMWRLRSTNLVQTSLAGWLPVWHHARVKWPKTLSSLVWF